MEKHIKFNDSDEELIRAISEYQRAYGLPSFISAIRKLCNDAIEIEKIRH